MSEEESETLQRIERKLERLASAVLGDREAGHLGLVARMDNHSGRIKRLERWRLYYAAIATGVIATLGIFYRLAMDWLKK